MLVKGQFVDVYVTHVESTGKTILVWAQTDHVEQNQLTVQMEEVRSRVSDLSTLSLGDVEAGDVCLAAYKDDKKWYRALVKDVDKPKSKVEVCLYDYGHIVTVQVDNLRKAEPRYFELGPQATLFQVANLEPSNGEEWLPEEMALIQVQVQNNEYSAHVSRVGSTGNPTLLQMFDGINSKSPLEEKLVAEGVGRVGEEDEHAASLPMTLLEPGQSHHVYMSFFNSPIDFWLQLAESSIVLDDLNGKIETAKESGLQVLPPNDVRTGALCIAHASEYSAFYRAVVSNVRQSENKCTVTYIDYGNNEEKKFDELYSLPHNFPELSSQAIHCCLFGAEAGPEDVERYMAAENLSASVINVLNSGKHLVNLNEEEFETATTSSQPSEAVLTQKISAARQHLTPVQFNVGSVFPVCISHVENTGLFYCQLMENRWKIDDLMFGVQAFYPQNLCQASSIEKTDAVIVRSSKENVYHRAEVLSASQDEVHVKLVDVGDTESLPLSEVFVIDERHVDFPSQAVCCQLDGTEMLPPSAVAAFLKSYESRKSLMAKIIIRTPKYCVVQLVDTNSEHEDVDLLSLLKEKTSTEAKTSLLKAKTSEVQTPKQSCDEYIHPSIKEGMVEDAIISYVDTPDNFYCKLVSSEDEFNSMSEEMEAYCNSLRPGQGRLLSVTVGSPCIAKDEDQEWYRAVITDVSAEEMVEVQFIDFGNPGEVPLDEVIAMKSKFMKLPIQTVRCGLRGVHCKNGSQWSDVHIERFSTVQNNNQLVHFTSHEPQNERYLVDMFGPYMDDSPVNINEAFGIQFGTLSPSYQFQKPLPSLKGSYLPPGSTNEVAQSGSKSQSISTPSTKSDTNCTGPPLSNIENHIGSRRKQSENSASSRTYQVPSQSIERKTNSSANSWASWTGNAQKPKSLPAAEISSGDTVYVAFVDSPSKFWCQPAVSSELLSSMAHKLNTEYTSMKDSQLALQSPSVGQMCCALYTEDYSWYRARVLDVSGRNAQVFFVDYGNSENISLSTLKELKECYTQLPCQAVECSLANILPRSGQWSDAAHDRFSKLCVDKELQVQLMDRKGDAYIVELGEVGRRGTNVGHALVQMGLALQISTPSLERSSSHGSSGSNSPSPARFDRVRLTPGESADVNVVYVSDPHSFFCQLTRNSTPLEDLMHTIARDLSRHDVAIKRIVRPRLGQICGAKYDPENKWYRAEVVASEGSQVKVNFVDYGDEQWIGTEGLKTLKKQHIEFPAQAVRCRLDNMMPASEGRWTKEAILSFEELVYDKNLVAQVLTERDGVYTIRLIVPGIGRRPDYSVGDRLMELGIGKHVEAVRQLRGRPAAEASIRPREDHLIDLRTMQLNVGQSYQMNLTWVQNPTEFWCQRAEASNKMSAMGDEIFEAYHSLSKNDHQLKNATVGQCCITLNTSDDSWYRARIIGQQGMDYEVRYVDYGDTGTVSASNLKKIMTRFASVPCQAFRCCLQSVEESDGEWNSNAVSVFEELLLQTITMTVSKKAGNKYTVLMQDQDGADVADKIKRLGFQQSQIRPLPREQQSSAAPVNHLDTELSSVRVGQTLSVQVVHVDNHMSFFCQIRSKIMARDDMMDKLDAHCRSLSAEEGAPALLEPGLYCVAMFSEDGGWYRARILERVGHTEYLVHYIDYGNKEVVHQRDLKELPPHCARLPAQALHCSLSGVQHQTRNAEATQKLMLLTDGKNLKAKAVIISDSKLQVELVDEASSKSINEEVANLFERNQDSCRPRSQPPMTHTKQTYVKRTVPIKTSVSVYPCHIESLGRFFLQFSSEEDQLTELATELNDKYCSMSPSQMRLQNAAVGDACTARFSDDGSWYRARIIELNRAHATVRFLDYGNTDQCIVAELKEVAEKYLKTPPFALECTLSVEEVGPDKMSQFEELLMSDDADVCAEFIDSAEPVSTKLKVNQKDVIDILSLKFKQPSFREAEVSTGVKVKVTPTSIESPSSFYLQVAAVEEESQVLVDTVNEYYTNLSADEMIIDDPTEGMACVAQFSEDNSWYRAIINSIAENQATVTFVDFGNTDVVPLDGIRQVTKIFSETAPYAIHCHLKGVAEPIGGWSDEQCADFESKLMEEDVMIAAEFQSSKIPVEVDLFINSRNLADIYQNATDNTGPSEGSIGTEEEAETQVAETTVECVYTTPSLNQGQILVVYASEVVSPSSFYVQLASQESELTNLAEEVNDYYNTSMDVRQLNHAQINIPCVAQYTDEDGTSAWYRAKIVDMDDNIATVLFVDYGNCEQISVKELKEITQKYLEITPYAMCCKLNSNITEEVAGRFAELLVEAEELTAEIVEVGDPIMVKLAITGRDLVTVLNDATYTALGTECGEEEPAKYAEPDVPDKEGEIDEGTLEALGSGRGDEEPALFAAPDGPDKEGDNTEGTLETSSAQGSRHGNEEPALFAAPDMADKEGEIDVGRPERSTAQETGTRNEEPSMFAAPDSPNKEEEIDVGRPELSTAQETGNGDEEYCAALGGGDGDAIFVAHDQEGEIGEGMLEHCAALGGGDGKEEPAMFAAPDVPHGNRNADNNVKSPVHTGTVHEGALDTYPSPDSGIGLQLEVVQKLEVYVSHVESPSQFWIQRVDTDESLEGMTEALKACADGPEINKEEVGVGKTFVARYSEDQTWQRVKVKAEPDTGKVHVIYVDYGNSEILDLCDLRHVPACSTLENKQPLATECMLRDLRGEDGTWSQSAICCFEELVFEKTLLAELDKVENTVPTECIDRCVPVRLLDMGVSVGKKLNEAGYAMNEVHKCSFNAESKKDQEWRGEISDPEQGGEIPDQELWGKNLDHELEGESPGDVSPVMSTEIEKADAVKFDNNQEEAEDSFLEMSLVKSSSFGSFGQSLSESELESESIKYRNIILEEGEVCSMSVMEAIDPDNIICQPEDSAAELNNVMKHLEEAYKDSQSLVLTEVHPGLPCVVQCTKDDKWYRGEVIRMDDTEMVEVYYVDIGRKEIVDLSRLQMLVPDEQLVTLPTQAVHCVLSGISPIEDIWHEDVGEFLRNILCSVSESVEVAVVGVEDDNRILVQITTSEQESLTDLLVENQLAKLERSRSSESLTQQCSLKQRELNTEEEYDVQLTHIVDPTQFWCQFESSAFDEFNRKLNEFYNSKRLCALNEPYEGVVCTIQDLPSNQWRRAQIESVYESTASVRLVDYGSVQTVSVQHLYPLRRQFIEAPVFAILCSLCDAQPRIGGEWTEAACDVLKGLQQSAPSLKIVKLQSNESVPNTVSLWLKDSGQSALQILVDAKHAKEPDSADPSAIER